MTGLQLAAVLIVAAAMFGTINALFIGLPKAIGILFVALVSSLLVLAVDALVPSLEAAERVGTLVSDLDFSAALLDGMLGLLLFAAALRVNIEDLRSEWAIILVMATIGVVMSAAIVGAGAAWLFGMPVVVALLFGAMVSPTDPVATLDVLREVELDRAVQTQIAGESLFNDGVAYILFLVLAGIAFPTTIAHHGEGTAALASLFVQEIAGGALLGFVVGWLAFSMMRRLTDPSLRILITLGVALGGYELALALEVSAPIMAVTAGLAIGNRRRAYAVTPRATEVVDEFWQVVDEILNALLFLMIGVEVFAIAFAADMVLVAVAAVALALLARLAAVSAAVISLRLVREFPVGVIPILTWGGLKGGVSIALALSLPDGEWRTEILALTYTIVVFSILVQGLTVARLARRYARSAAEAEEPSDAPASTDDGGERSAP